MAKENEKPIETKENNKHLPILANGRGLALRSIDDMWRFACSVANSGLAPKSFTRPEQILIAIQSGAELGMPPMRSLQSFCVIKGQARLWGSAPLALVHQSGKMEYIIETIEGEGDNRVAVCKTKRKDKPNEVETRFSVDDAKQANLWNNPDKPTWKQYPERMLKYRARSFNLQDNFPECFGGSTIAEEYEGVDMPEQALTPDAGSREQRKQIDAEVKDTASVLKEELKKVYINFATTAEFDLNVKFELCNITDKELWPIFAEFAGWVLGKDDCDKEENWTIKDTEEITSHIALNGIHKDFLVMIPVPKETETEK